MSFNRWQMLCPHIWEWKGKVLCQWLVPLGRKLAVSAMPVGFRCQEKALFSVDVLRESHYAAIVGDAGLSVTYLRGLMHPGEVCKIEEWWPPFTSCFQQKGRCTPGEKGPVDAWEEKRRILGYQRQYSSMRLTHSLWHQWLVVMETLFWRWNVIFSLLLLTKHGDL